MCVGGQIERRHRHEIGEIRSAERIECGVLGGCAAAVLLVGLAAAGAAGVDSSNAIRLQ